MIKTVATFFILSVAAACVTTGATPADVDAFNGQRSAPLLAKLGKPDSQERTAAGTVYRWRTEVRQESAPVRTTTTEYPSGRPVIMEGTTFMPETQSCTLVMIADAAGTVSSFTRNGSRQACAPLLTKLDNKAG
jgi:hypothetical protein